MRAVLEKLRKSLLDLTRRNRLLNFRDQGRGSLRIVEELPEQIWRMVVGEGRSMQFLAQAEVEGVEGAEEDEEAEEVDAVDEARLDEVELHARHTDRFLQTTLESEALSARLLHLSREARSSLEERGCNTLFLTLGLVEWTDPGPGGVVSRAPLLFVPVSLSRKNVNSRFRLKVLDEEVVANPSLLELAERVFKVHLPDIVTEQGEVALDLSAYFESVQDVIEDVPGWTFCDEIHLGLFSFAKLLLYRDLDPDHWPAGNGLLEHELVRLLIGEPDAAGFDGPGVPALESLDLLDPEECFQVVDADSSQRAAIQAARAGAHLVIQGPPGTGKSQTITNIIAECLAAGKTVLFVAEKAAALDVVHRRLEAAGLGEFLLELHSRNASKKAVLENLEAALRPGGGRRAQGGAGAAALKRSRDRLNAYVRELHSPCGALLLSPFEAMLRAGQLRDELEAPFQIEDPFAWTAPELDQTIERIGTLDRCLARVGALDQHPWRGATLTSAGVEVRQKVMARRDPVLESLARLTDLAMTLTEGLKTGVPETAGALTTLIEELTLLCETPASAADLIDRPEWNTLSAPLEQWLRKGRERAERRERFKSVMTEDAEQVDWQAALDRRRADGSSWIRFLKPSWHRDGRLLRACLETGALPEVPEQIELLRALCDSRRLRAELGAEEPRFAPAFGVLYTGLDGDFAELERLARTMVAIRRIVLRRALSPESIRIVLRAEDRTGLSAVLARARQQLEDFERVVAHWLEPLQADPAGWFGDALERIPFEQVARRFRGLESEFERLADWVDYQRALAACREQRLRSFLSFALGPRGEPARGRLKEVFQRQFYFLFADRAVQERELLDSFRGADHEERIQAFRAADRAWIEAGRERLRRLLLARRPDLSHDAGRASKLGILKHEMKKKCRHMALRKLFALVGDVVQGIKPCFMMSPISVAQYLEPGQLQFDVVIFDEASQVEPADAFGAIARGRQLLLIGDEKQLPPTNFFTKLEAESDDEDDELASPSDLESVLGLGAVRFPNQNQCALRWHYRSLHESLIEFSNAQFYGHRLKVFPSPRADRRELGLLHHHVEAGVYLRGASHTNPIEAREVAERVLRHAAGSPELTLGVGAFSLSQQRAIEDQVELLRRQPEHRRAEPFFRAHPEEPFFVKNLETIQGDERDVILLSVGYGKDPDGKLSLNMGPLNREGGWRRLNVLVTRARRRCEVFSSWLPDELRAQATAARGVLALKAFLEMAAAAHSNGRAPDGDRRLSPLERSVRDALIEKGFDVQSQVGSEGFFIDLAVVDPEQPGRYLLGIECDGVPYLEAATARDRDRTRPEVLSARGWQLERVWSAEWFRRPEAVIERLCARLSELRASGGASAERPVPAPPAPSEPSEPRVRPAARAPAESPERFEYRVTPDRVAGSLEDLLALTPAKLCTLILEIARAEAPIHTDEALKRVCGWYDTRAGARAKAAFEAALARVLDAGRLERRGEFLWLPDQTEVEVRYRAADCPVTDVDLIPPEEFEAAICLALQRELGIPESAIASSVCGLLGFKRSGPRLTLAIEAALKKLQEDGRVTQDAAGFLNLADALRPGSG